MNSDFDDLLKEFEVDYKAPSSSTNKVQSRAEKTDIDSFLEELKGIEKVEPLKQPSRARPDRPEERKKTIQKCYPLVVSGNLVTGHCVSSVSMIACEKMRCTRCDLPVKRFVNKLWKPESEYLFFRNNFSRDDKLATMLYDAPGSAAYSCQCLWKNVSTNTVLNGDAWVCAGHLV